MTRSSIKLSAMLNDIAHALAMVAPIYTSSGNSALPMVIPESELIIATFTRGAQVIESAAKILGAAGLRHARGGGWSD